MQKVWYFEDGTEIKADIIVANADLPYVYRKLLPDKRQIGRTRQN